MNNLRPFRPGCSRCASPWPAVRTIGGPPLPIADVDPITDASTALVLFDAIAATPPVHETLVILLDHEHRGSTIISVDGTMDNDSVLHIASRITEMARCVDDIGAVIIASVRPGGSDELDDVDRWLTIDEQLDLVGIELVEWFVFGRSVSCPRALLGDPARWAA